MSRTPIVVREAEPSDAPALVQVWNDVARRPVSDRPAGPPIAEAMASLARIAADPDERLVVALIDDQIVGGAYLTRASVTPLHTEDAVHISHLQVVEGARKHGVGKLLVQAAVTWAEEKGTPTVLAMATASSRDANRFLARL